jgi:phosphatidylglycerol:prolipoprotein diacylglycerol transferase
VTGRDLLALAVAFAGAVAAATLLRAQAIRHGLSARAAVDALFVTIAAGLLIGHAADVVLYRFDELARDWTAALPGSGGSCTLGALVGGGLAGAAWLHRRGERPRFWRHADQLALALLLGWGIARLGCFLSHDHLGALTTFPLGIATPGGRRHDLGLYEAVLTLALWAVMLALDRRRPAPGTLVAVAAVGFAVGRFGLELLRVDDPRYHGLTLVQYVMPALAALGVGIGVGVGVVPAHTRAMRPIAWSGGRTHTEEVNKA